jgi:hypothetical protein
MTKREPTVREVIVEVRDMVRELRDMLRAEFAEIRKRVDVPERPKVARVVLDPSKPEHGGATHG